MPATDHPTLHPLLPFKSHSGAELLEALQSEFSEITSNDGMLELAISKAGNHGWQYLFEVPGCLFDNPTASVAAMLAKSNDGTPRLIFLLSDHSQGLLQIVEEEGINENTLEFVDAYAGVLEMLGEINKPQKLHS